MLIGLSRQYAHWLINALILPAGKYWWEAGPRRESGSLGAPLESSAAGTPCALLSGLH